MGRASISFTAPNDEWMKKQVDSQEYTSRSELVNDLIRKARKQEQESESATIRAALIEGEKSGISDRTPDDIINAVIERKRDNGGL